MGCMQLITIMDFKKLVSERYTTKQYNPSKKVAASLIQQLKEILVLCPSSVNAQPWKFTFISNDKLKNELSKVSYHNTEKIQQASHLVVFSAIDDLKLLKKQFEENATEEKLALFNQFFNSLTEQEAKIWIEKQCYIALGFFLSACASLQIDSTAMEGIEKESYAKILKLHGYKPQFAVCIGYRDTNDYNDPSRSPKSRIALEKIVEEIL